MDLLFKKVRGQCYDGVSAMSSSKSGVVKLKEDLEPQAVYTHCYGHALNLAAADTVKQCKIMKDAPETTTEILKLINFHHTEMGSFGVSRKLCPQEAHWV